MLRLLLAEDNLGDVLLVQQALEEHHISCELHVVKDGAEALEFVRHMGLPGEAPCPDIVLMDLNLPKIDGPQVLMEFRKHTACAHTPVIVVTSADTPSDRARLSNLGITRYFKKPSDYDAYLRLGALIKEVAGESEKALSGRT